MELPRRSSLVGQVAELLRRGIAKGEWRDHLPGEGELQNRLKVGRNTLRSALHILQREGWIKVSQGRRRRIERRPVSHPSPREIKSVGVLAGVPFHTLPSFSLFLISELQKDLQKIGVALEIHADRRFNVANPSRALTRLLQKHRAACWVLMAPSTTVCRWLCDRQIPVMQIGTSTEDADVPLIDVDVQALARHAVGTLLARGHKRIGLIRPRADSTDSDRAERGAQEGFSKASQFAEARLNVIQLPNIPREIHTALDAVFAAPDRPTALMIAWTKQVLKVTSYLALRGIRMPQDISLVSMGHLPYLDDISPSVAHYTFDWYAYARRLQQMVRQAVAVGHLTPRRTLLIPRFVDGGSLSDPPG